MRITQFFLPLARSKLFSAWKVWNRVHQHPPHTPLCRCARSAKASQVSGPSALIVKVSVLAVPVMTAE
ncbi:MAG: hypothetical protein QOJ60_2037 [Actinomycetota bacterium]|nr:hypothetical protein [Actinomycetota bacterium]